MGSGRSLGERSRRLRAVIAERVDREKAPGLVTGLARLDEDGIEGVGVRALDSTEPITSDTIFRVASLTKPIVAAATMSLVDEGKLELDGSIERHLPELAGRRVLKDIEGLLDETVPARRSITVRDLLTCRMGFGIVHDPSDAHPIQKAAEELQLCAFGPPHPRLPPPPDEWIRRFSTLPLMVQPGERWLYNSSFEVLAVLLARAAGQPLERLLCERLFDPLDMKDTRFSVPAGKISRLSACYGPAKAGGFERVDPAEGGAWSQPPAFPSGAGGLVSTARDLLAFGRMMLAQGTHAKLRVLSAASVQAMTRDQLTPEQKVRSPMSADPAFWHHNGWGLGLAIATSAGARKPVGAFGWEGGFGTSWTCDPRDGTVAVLLTQWGASPAFGRLYDDFWDSLCGSPAPIS
ncbi:MAG: serine hydrolase domain-containing protein [Polyangiaceae bacterium]